MEPHLITGNQGRNLRQMIVDDGPQLTELVRNSPDQGYISIQVDYLLNPFLAYMALHHNMIGAVVEAGEYNGIVGSGIMAFGECLVDETCCPFGYLNSLVVAPSRRRQGIGSDLVRWLADCTWEQIGNDGLIFAGIQNNNAGSLSTVSKIGLKPCGKYLTSVIGTRTKPPDPLPDVVVRPATANDLAAVAEYLNQFYQGYNLYSPQTGDTLLAWLQKTPFDSPFRHYYVAVDEDENILAGMGFTEDYRMRIVHIKIPTILSILNRLVHLVPIDGVLRQVMVSKIWFAPGQRRVAGYLWETMRWQWRDRVNSMVTSFDPRSPLSEIFRLPGWLPNKSEFLLAVNRPPTANEASLFYVP